MAAHGSAGWCTIVTTVRANAVVGGCRQRVVFIALLVLVCASDAAGDVGVGVLLLFLALLAFAAESQTSPA